MTIKMCKNPECMDHFNLKYGFCPACRLMGRRGAYFAFAVVALFKFAVYIGQHL